MTFPSVTPRDFALVALTQTYVRQKAKQSLETLNANELLRRCPLETRETAQSDRGPCLGGTLPYQEG